MNLKVPSALFLVCLISCAAPPEKTDPTTEKIEAFESNLSAPIYIEGDSTWTIEERMEHYGIPGASVAVIADGEIAWVKTYGHLDKEKSAPIETTTLFQAASISKPVSAYAALTLVEQGKIDLTQNINEQLKSYQIAENEFTVDKKVNVKNLLNHSAGVNVHGFLGYSPGLPVPSLEQILNGRPPANSDSLLVNKVPEESFRYSGGGYNIVQQLMIDVEGKTYPEIMEEMVLGPLGMTHSSYAQPLPDSMLAKVPTGYLPDGSMVLGKRHTYPEMSPAGLWTTPEDLAKFAIHIQESLKGNTDKGLSKEMTQQFVTPWVSEDMGLGIFIQTKKDEIYFGHGGWNEGFSSELVAHRDKGYGAVVMINSNHPSFISEVMRAVALTYGWDDYFSQYEAMEPKTIDETIIGKYVVRGYDYIEVSVENGQLMYQDGPEEPRMEFVQISDSFYVGRQFDVLFQFKENESGQMDIHILNPNNMQPHGVYTQQLVGDTLPIEIILSGDMDGALEAYRAIKASNPEDPNVNEANLNSFGYRFLGYDQAEIAKDIFEINMRLYPESFNVYDSYAEACMILGDNDRAIEYYEKSLDINPDNYNAVLQLKRIAEQE